MMLLIELFFRFPLIFSLRRRRADMVYCYILLLPKDLAKASLPPDIA